MISRFRTLVKRKDFSYHQFMSRNSISFDRITGVFPMVFSDYRLTLHVLRLSWAFYLTLKMCDLDRFGFPQRVRDHSWKRRSGNHLTQLFIHLFSSFKQLDLDEKSLIKCIKNSLCFHVSESLEQMELPEGDRINLVPVSFRGYFASLSSQKRIKFFFSLLQSKSLCQEVPDSFVQDALEKHAKQISTDHRGVPQNFLTLLRERGRSFGSLVSRFYQPNRGFIPSNRATFNFPRNMGGVKGDLVFHDRMKTSGLPSGRDRMEPLVIGLFGQPGMGKSSVLPRLLSFLRELFPGVSENSLTYERTCNVEFWDGYNDQPIVILDDLGQSLGGEDIKEFQTLVSCNPYVLPMADLERKGKLFSSPIIIATSNLQYGHTLRTVYQNQFGILDDASFWRRFHVPLYVEDHVVHSLKVAPSWIRPENLLMRKGTSRCIHATKTFDFSKMFYQRQTLFRQQSEVLKQDIWAAVQFPLMMEELLQLYRKREKFHENIRRTWIQHISTRSEDVDGILKDFQTQCLNFRRDRKGFSNRFKKGDPIDHCLHFPAFPPREPLPIRVAPILEPLKVRTITAGRGDTFCLKPLQRAMWLALGEEKQFCLTHGTNRLEGAIHRIYDNSRKDDIWISGDYSAATDSFSIEATRALLEGVLESIDHEPTKRWALKEISPHLVCYPEGSGILPVTQKSGQMMGSLLSFPLLCLLNDCTAKHIGLSPDQYLINGDDILMRCNPEKYSAWKQAVEGYGLDLSLGKNYLHKDYGTVNSQLIFRDTVLCAGKQRVLDRRTQVLGECLRDLEMAMAESPPDSVQELFKTVNRQKLSKTVRSISVPVSHGGLSLSWGSRSLRKSSSRTEILCYLHDLFQKVRPEKGCLVIPYLSSKKVTQWKQKEAEDSFLDPIDSKEYHEEFIGVGQLRKVQERVMKNQDLRDLFLHRHLTDLPSLSFLHSLQVPFKDEKERTSLQRCIDRSFFRLFLDESKEFSYEVFRREFIGSALNLPTTVTASVKFLLEKMELDLQPDFIEKIPVGYHVRDLDHSLFQKKLGKAFNPKHFDLPPDPDSPDFSVDLVRSFRSICNNLDIPLDKDFPDYWDHFSVFHELPFFEDFVV